MSESVQYGMMALSMSSPRSAALSEAAIKRSERMKKMKAGRAMGKPIIEATSPEAVVDKKMAKILRNRENAARIRREKKEETERLKMEHQSLTEMVANLKDENAVLQDRIGKIHKVLRARAGQPGLQRRAPGHMATGLPTGMTQSLIQDSRNS